MRTILSAAILAMSLLIAQPVLPATMNCNTHEYYIKSLFEDYNEKPVIRGILFDGNVIEILVSDTGSWTGLVTSPNKRSCIIMYGYNWEKAPPTSSGFDKNEIFL